MLQYIVPDSVVVDEQGIRLYVKSDGVWYPAVKARHVTGRGTALLVHVDRPLDGAPVLKDGQTIQHLHYFIVCQSRGSGRIYWNGCVWKSNQTDAKRYDNDSAAQRVAGLLGFKAFTAQVDL